MTRRSAWQQPMRTRFLAVVAAVLAGPVLPLAPSSTAGADGVRSPDQRAALETCLGRPATVDGAGRRQVRGTPRRDVVVTNGAESVLTGPGRDIICVTGSAGFAVVVSGDGDDVVVNQGRTGLIVHLGRGVDRFRGGAAGERVDVRDGGADVILLGGGDDTASVDADHLAGMVVRGGPGTDQVSVDAYRARGASVLVADNEHQQLRRGSIERPMRGFERFYLTGIRAAVGFAGSRRAEFVYLNGRIGDVQLGAGDDVLRLYEPVAVGSVRGGTGVDSIQTEDSGAIDAVSADLAAGVMTLVDGDRQLTFPVGGLNVLDLTGLRVDVTGSDGPETIRAYACFGVLDGGAGDDVLQGITEYDDEIPNCEGQHSDLRGGLGDDVLVGSVDDDTMIGGDGNDTADGGLGVDRCSAETELGCELPGSSRRAVRQLRQSTTGSFVPGVTPSSAPVDS